MALTPWCSHEKSEYICEKCLKCGGCCKCSNPIPGLIHRNSKRAYERDREMRRADGDAKGLTTADQKAHARDV
jgi:hypothetical protein